MNNYPVIRKFLGRKVNHLNKNEKKQIVAKAIKRADIEEIIANKKAAEMEAFELREMDRELANDRAEEYFRPLDGLPDYDPVEFMD